ncbi:exopolysaccharide transport family protein [Devosia sp.]|uniref:exopolysaccharide transport family protein n=1 Tax=Devosia sp. TaxID=1871048 RepID=UPI00326380B1
MTIESQAARDARIDTAAIAAAVWSRMPRILMVLLVILAATFVVLSFMPKLYESSASILVEPRSNVYIRSPNESAPQLTGGEAGVVSSQIELLKSRDTLLKVVNSEKLADIPEFNGASGGFSPLGMIFQLIGRKGTPVSPEEIALGNLYDRMTVIQERDSRIITVLVRSTDPQLAARLANAVAKAHVARRAELSLSDTAEASGWLKDEIDKLRTSVTQAENAVANFKVDNDLYTASNNSTLLDQQLSSLATQMSAAQERKNTALSRATLIRGLIDRGQPLEGVPDVRDSVVIQQLSQEKAKLQGERAQKAATLLGSHPVIRALDAQIAELVKQIGVEGGRVADALEAEAQIEDGIETKMRADLDSMKGSASAATKETVTLDSLQREAKAQRDLLEGYLQRYSEASSRTDAQSALPDVRVVTLAAPSVQPASPKTPLILLAVGIVTLIGQIGLVIFGELMSGRAIVRRNYEPLMDRSIDAEPHFEAEAELAAGHVEAFEDEDEAEQESAEPFHVEAVAAVAAEPEAGPASENSETVRRRSPQAAASRSAYAAAASEIAPARTTNPRAAAPFVAPAPMQSTKPRVKPLNYAALSSDLVLGRTRIVLLAGNLSHKDCATLAMVLAADALDRGLSVALVDAGSGRPSIEPGIADLSVEKASFGDVVHKSAEEGFAEIPWGHAKAIDRRSAKPLTLIEALSDIYEVVILMTGRIGMTSTLPLFAELSGRLVLVAGENYDPEQIEDAREQLAEAGYGEADVVLTPRRAAA